LLLRCADGLQMSNSQSGNAPHQILSFSPVCKAKYPVKREARIEIYPIRSTCKYSRGISEHSSACCGREADRRSRPAAPGHAPCRRHCHTTPPSPPPQAPHAQAHFTPESTSGGACRNAFGSRTIGPPTRHLQRAEPGSGKAGTWESVPGPAVSPFSVRLLWTGLWFFPSPSDPCTRTPLPQFLPFLDHRDRDHPPTPSWFYPRPRCQAPVGQSEKPTPRQFAHQKRKPSLEHGFPIPRFGSHSEPCGYWPWSRGRAPFRQYPLTAFRGLEVLTRRTEEF
jgi:hypothetical protein